MRRAPQRPRNDPRQYDDLADEWWDPHGVFSALHWLAAARAAVLPPPPRPGAVLLDLACGGGLMAPHVDGYRHVGVDLTASALRQAADHGILAVQGDATAIPVADGAADVVVAGEVFEHVPDLEGCVAEIGRVLAPGGLLVCDTLNDTWLSRFLMVTVGERVPGGAPPGLHDPALFVRPDRLQRLCRLAGIDLEVWGLAVHPRDFLRFLRGRGDMVRMPRIGLLSVLYQGVGRKLALASTQ